MAIPFSLEDIVAGSRFLRQLPSFLRHPLTPKQAVEVLRRRLENRTRDFLLLAKRSIYGNPQSPYFSMLRHIGCEYGDLEQLVTTDGIEGSLEKLLQQGIYLTADELKGRRDVVRGSMSASIQPEDCANPLAASHVWVQTSGSTGARTSLGIDLSSVFDHAVNLSLALNARGADDWAHALWEVPGGAAMRVLLRYAIAANAPERWFSQIQPGARDLHPRYRWSARLMSYGALLAGVSIPPPEYAAPEHPREIASWAHHVLERGGTPHLNTYASCGVRICQTAAAQGIDIEGMQFTLTGEPITRAKIAALAQAGACAAGGYGNMESGGRLAYGCLEPEFPDDFHWFHDLHALIQPDKETGSSLPRNALLITSLRATAPLILLNFAIGDQAIVGPARCGCALCGHGWSTRVHSVRSQEKLTAGGMTFSDTDVIKIIEEILPQRFGGTAIDYQLVEEEDADGNAHLRLRVHPAVGRVDEAAVIETLLEHICQGADSHRVMGTMWRNARLLEVDRRAPSTTQSGKVLHLHRLVASG